MVKLSINQGVAEQVNFFCGAVPGTRYRVLVCHCHSLPVMSGQNALAHGISASVSKKTNDWVLFSAPVSQRSPQASVEAHFCQYWRVKMTEEPPISSVCFSCRGFIYLIKRICRSHWLRISLHFDIVSGSFVIQSKHLITKLSLLWRNHVGYGGDRTINFATQQVQQNL